MLVSHEECSGSITELGEIFIRPTFISLVNWLLDPYHSHGHGTFFYDIKRRDDLFVHLMVSVVLL